MQHGAYAWFYLILCSTFKWLGWYFNFSAWVMKTLFKLKKILWIEWHFMENKTEMHFLKTQQISLFPKCLIWISRGVFLHVFVYTTGGCLKVNYSFCTVPFYITLWPEDGLCLAETCSCVKIVGLNWKTVFFLLSIEYSLMQDILMCY